MQQRGKQTAQQLRYHLDPHSSYQSPGFKCCFCLWSSLLLKFGDSRWCLKELVCCYPMRGLRWVPASQLWPGIDLAPSKFQINLFFFKGKQLKLLKDRINFFFFFFLPSWKLINLPIGVPCLPLLFVFLYHMVNSLFSYAVAPEGLFRKTDLSGMLCRVNEQHCISGDWCLRKSPLRPR